MDVYVPDDILIEILLRVPVDNVVICKRVCRRWRDMISSALFVNLHVTKLSRGEDESLLIRSCYDGFGSGSQILYYNVPHYNKRERSKVELLVNFNFTDSDTCKITNSCDGLVVLDDFDWSRVLNPVTGVVRKIDKSPTKIYNSRVHLYGIYFDRFIDEYKLFYVAYGRPMDHYLFFSLSRNVWKSFSRTSSMDIRPKLYSQAAIVGDVMYWIGSGRQHCSKVVVAFDIQREQFYCLPHPPSNGACATNPQRLIDVIHGRMMRLIIKDGQLCFCHALLEERIINLWILEDNANWESWVLKYKMRFVCIYSSSSLFGVSSKQVEEYLGSVNLVCSQKNSNEIVFTLSRRLLNLHAGGWLYNVETHKTKPLGASSIRRSSTFYSNHFMVIPYNKSLLSPFM